MSYPCIAFGCISRPAVPKTGSRLAATTTSATVPRAKWYSPQLRRDLVTRLYFRARAEGIPMTRLADRLIDEALARPAIVYGEVTARVAEEPPTPSLRWA
jgi:hypothetical protein